MTMPTTGAEPPMTTLRNSRERSRTHSSSCREDALSSIDRWIGDTRRKSARLATVVAIVVAGFGCGGSAPLFASENVEAFCEIALTSLHERTQEEVDDHHADLMLASPESIRAEIAILRDGWDQVGFPFTKAELEPGGIQRAPEVRAAAGLVAEYVRDRCGFEGGVYRIFPEVGL